jgi:DNA-binding beta-propeller fold protein YncE
MYNLSVMRARLPIVRWFATALLFALAWTVAPTITQAQQIVEQDITATKRLYPDLGGGIWSIKRGPAGHYYILVGRSVLVFGDDQQRLTEIPPPPTKDYRGAPQLVYGVAFDVDAAGKVYVADRAANILRIFSPDGSTLLNISFPAPTGVAVLPSGEIVAASANSDHLITVFDARGRELRSIGDQVDFTENHTFNHFLNVGHLATDPANNIYFAFNYFPEPTFRKYDRAGYAQLDISLTTVEFAPGAQAARREIKRETQTGNVPELKPTVSCIGVDPVTQRIWLAFGNEIMLFEKDGLQLAEYRLYTPEGGRLILNSILVEPERLIITSDPLGIYEFPRPDKLFSVPSSTPKPF